MHEELGNDVLYELGKQTVFFRHERLEEEAGHTIRIFAVGYQATYLGGTIILPSYLKEYRWVDKNTPDLETYFTGGWKIGVQEYLK